MPRGIPGPVIKDKKTSAKGNALAFKPKPKPRGKPFKKGGPGGPGRPPGSLNKFSGEVKQVILDGINSAHPDGLAHWVQALAILTPTSAAALLGRLIPVNMEVKGDHTHTVTIKFE